MNRKDGCDKFYMYLDTKSRMTKPQSGCTILLEQFVLICDVAPTWQKTVSSRLFYQSMVYPFFPDPPPLPIKKQPTWYFSICSTLNLSCLYIRGQSRLTSKQSGPTYKKSFSKLQDILAYMEADKLVCLKLSSHNYGFSFYLTNINKINVKISITIIFLYDMLRLLHYRIQKQSSHHF